MIGVLFLPHTTLQDELWSPGTDWKQILSTKFLELTIYSFLKLQQYENKANGTVNVSSWNYFSQNIKTCASSNYYLAFTQHPNMKRS